jgi:hypothetical protein
MNSAKVAEFSKPTMALLANITAADLKKEWPLKWTDV